MIAAVRGCGLVLRAIVLVALAWAASGLYRAAAQTNGVPDEKTLEEALKKKPAAKPSPNSAATKKAAGQANASPESPKPAHRGTLIPMVVVSDVACTLEVNGDSIAVLEPGAVKKLSVWPGDQLVKCASTEEPGEIYSGVQNVKAGEQSVLQIVLAPRLETVRQNREAQAKSLLAEDELWAQAGEHGTPDNLKAYLDKYPDGRYVEQAKGFLAESARRAEEDADWKRAARSTQMAVVQAYVDKYPAGRYLDAAQQRITFVKQIPARPNLPFPIDEDTWETLENSSFYMDLPRRTHKVTVQISSKVLGEPINGSTSAIWNQATTKEIVPLSDKCVLLHTVKRKSEPTGTPPEVIDDYQCGALKMGTVGDGKVIGAVSMSDVQAFLDSDKALREKPTCEIPSTGPANAFHPALTGIATRHGCSSGDYYFEDLNVWLYELGEMDPQKQQYVVPSSGYHFESVADGGAGGKITTSYEAFSWTDST